MNYRCKHHVGYAGKIHDPDTIIAFKDGDEAQRDRLLEAGAIEEAKGEKATFVPKGARGDEKPSMPDEAALRKLAVAKLIDQAKVENVAVEDNDTKDQLVEKILAGRKPAGE